MLITDVIKHVVEEKSAYVVRISKQQDSLPNIRYDAIQYFGCGKKKGFVIIDLFTANAMLTIYNAINKQNKNKFNSILLSKLIDLTWKHVK